MNRFTTAAIFLLILAASVFAAGGALKPVTATEKGIETRTVTRAYQTDAAPEAATEPPESDSDQEELHTPEQREMALYEAAVVKFGERAQILMAVEEMSELTKSLLKYVRHEDFNQGDYDAIIASVEEERADVSIMLNQLDVIFGDNSEAEQRKLEHLAAIVEDDDE